MATAPHPYLIRANEGESTKLGGVGVDFKVPGSLTGGRLAIVEHPVAPRAMVPPHVHRQEDELSYIVAGRIGVRIGDDEFEAGPGDYVWKPRDIPHVFWNPSMDDPARIVEILLPADFERYFVQMGRLFAEAGGRPDPAASAPVAAQFGLELRMDWLPDLLARHGISLG